MKSRLRLFSINLLDTGQSRAVLSLNGHQFILILNHFYSENPQHKYKFASVNSRNETLKKHIQHMFSNDSFCELNFHSELCKLVNIPYHFEDPNNMNDIFKNYEDEDLRIEICNLTNIDPQPP